MTESTTVHEPKKQDVSSATAAASALPVSSTLSLLSFLVDLVKVSRPGWWIVTVWLYVAPAATKAALDTSIFWLGLLYCCLPLNVVVYGLNDYADVPLDATNLRKGNLLFGPRLTRQRLAQLIKVAVTCTFLPLFAFAYYDRHSQQEHYSLGSFLLRYLVWFALVLVVNVAYNFDVLGHFSQNGPFEIPIVYFGFSLVTVLSYWLNGGLPSTGPTESNNDNVIFGYRPDSSLSDHDENDSPFFLFGCNANYWIHLMFLVCRTQLWTEYMDYETDRSHKRKTTLTRFCSNSKASARNVVLLVLLAEAAWNWRQTMATTNRSDYKNGGHEWNTLFCFSLLGVLSFCAMEVASHWKGSMAAKSAASTTTTSSSGSLSISPFVWVALVQSMGGLWLIQDCWHKQVFVT